MKVTKVILSRGRHDTITTHKILTDFDLVVPQSELNKYKEVVTNANNIV